MERGGKVYFAMSQCPDSVRSRIEGEGAKVKLLEEDDTPELLRRIAEAVGAAWIVVDGYRFTTGYVRELVGFGSKVLLIDDDARLASYNSQLVLNQNVYATPSIYESKLPSTRLLLGTAYAMLRKEFVNRAQGARDISRSSRLLASFGGTDPSGLSWLLLDAVARQRGTFEEIRLVVGGANPRLEGLRTACKQLAGVTLVEDAHDMPELMEWADMAICAAGSTTWELCYFGVPMILISAAENQMLVGKAMSDRQAAIYLGGTEETTSEKICDGLALLRNDAVRQSLTENAKRLVDGKGAERVLSAMINEEEN
jgi:UDP-2,4-diacetamido-2,4,6-trideoxy-beta-L-altropyranose hydrolase